MSPPQAPGDILVVGCLGVKALEVGPSPLRLARGLEGEGSLARRATGPTISRRIRQPRRSILA